MFQITVLTPLKKLLVDEPVSEVYIPGHEGEMHVLPGHAPLMTTMKTGILKYKLENSDQLEQMVVSWGYAQVSSQGVNILAETAETPAEIDVARAKEAQARAEKQLENLDLEADVIMKTLANWSVPALAKTLSIDLERSFSTPINCLMTTEGRFKDPQFKSRWVSGSLQYVFQPQSMGIQITLDIQLQLKGPVRLLAKTASLDVQLKSSLSKSLLMKMWSTDSPAALSAADVRGFEYSERLSSTRSHQLESEAYRQLCLSRPELPVDPLVALLFLSLLPNGERNWSKPILAGGKIRQVELRWESIKGHCQMRLALSGGMSLDLHRAGGDFFQAITLRHPLGSVGFARVPEG